MMLVKKVSPSLQEGEEEPIDRRRSFAFAFNPNPKLDARFFATSQLPLQYAGQLEHTWPASSFFFPNLWFDFDLGRQKNNVSVVTLSSFIGDEVHDPKSLLALHPLFDVLGREAAFEFFRIRKTRLEPLRHNIVYDSEFWPVGPDDPLFEVALDCLQKPVSPPASHPCAKRFFELLANANDSSWDTSFAFFLTRNETLAPLDVLQFFDAFQHVHRYFQSTEEKRICGFSEIDKMYLLAPRQSRQLHGPHSPSSKVMCFLVRFQDKHCELLLLGENGHVRLVCGREDAEWNSFLHQETIVKKLQKEKWLSKMGRASSFSDMASKRSHDLRYFDDKFFRRWILEQFSESKLEELQSLPPVRFQTEIKDYGTHRDHLLIPASLQFFLDHHPFFAGKEKAVKQEFVSSFLFLGSQRSLSKSYMYSHHAVMHIRGPSMQAMALCAVPLPYSVTHPHYPVRERSFKVNNVFLKSNWILVYNDQKLMRIITADINIQHVLYLKSLQIVEFPDTYRDTNPDSFLICDSNARPSAPFPKHSLVKLCIISRCRHDYDIRSGQYFKPTTLFFNEDQSLFLPHCEMTVENNIKRFSLTPQLLVEPWIIDFSEYDETIFTLEWSVLRLHYDNLFALYNRKTQTMYPYRWKDKKWRPFRFIALVVPGVIVITDEIREEIKKSWSPEKLDSFEDVLLIPGSLVPLLKDPSEAFVLLTNHWTTNGCCVPIHIPYGLNDNMNRYYISGKSIQIYGDLFSAPWMISYPCEKGFILLDDHGNHLQITNTNPLMVSLMACIPLFAEGEVFLEDLQTMFNRSVFDDYKWTFLNLATRYIQWEFGLDFSEIKLHLQGEMVAGFVNFLTSLEYLFISNRVRVIDLPNLMKLGFAGSTPCQDKLFRDKYVSTTRAYSIYGKEQAELISASTRGNVRLWNQYEIFMAGLEETLCVAAAKIAEASAAAETHPEEFQESVAREFVKKWTRSINSPVVSWLGAYNIVYTDLFSVDSRTHRSTFFRNLHREFLDEHLPAEMDRAEANEDAFLIPALEETLVHALNFSAPDDSSAYVMNHLSHSIVGNRLDPAAFDAMMLLGKLREVDIQQCVLLLTGSKTAGDLHVWMFFPTSGANKFTLRTNAGVGDMRWDSNVYYEPLPMFANMSAKRYIHSAYDIQDKMFDFRRSFRDLASLVKERLVSIGGEGTWKIGESIMASFAASESPNLAVLHDDALSKYALKWHQSVPSSFSCSSSSIDHHTDLPKISDAFVLAVNVRNMSVVVGESPWQFAELRGCREWLEKIFYSPNTVSASYYDRSSDWLDENHRVLYNEEDLQTVYLSATWVCVSGFGKEARDRDSEVFLTPREMNRFVAVHDLDLLGEERLSEVLNATTVHQFTKESVFGYFAFQDFMQDLSSVHFFNMFSSYIVDQDLVIQGPNDYMVVGGFADPARWKKLEGCTRDQRVFLPDCASAVYHHRVVRHRNAFFVKWNGVVVYGSGDPAASSSSKVAPNTKKDASASSSSFASSFSSASLRRGIQGKREVSEDEEDPNNPPPPPPSQKKCSEEDLLLRRQQPRFGIVPAHEVPVVVWKVARLRPSTWSKNDYSLNDVRNWPFCVLKMVLPNDAVYVRPFERFNTQIGIHGKCRTDKAFVWEIQEYNFNIDPNKTAKRNHGTETRCLDPETTVAVSAFCDDARNIQEYRCNQLVSVDDLDVEADTCCTRGIHVFEQRHHVVMMTGDSFGCDVSPLEIIRVMFDLNASELSKKTRDARARLGPVLDLANLLSTQDREKREEQLRESLELLDLNFEEEAT